MKSLFSRLRRTSNELGAVNAFLYAISIALDRLSRTHVTLRRYYFVAQPVSEAPRLPAHRGNNIVLRWLHSSEPAIEAMRPSAVLRQRFAEGAVCLLAQIDGNFCGFLWINLDRYREDEVRGIYVPVPARESAWDFDVYVDPAYRIGFVFLKLWDECNRFLRAQGVHTSFSRISAFNSGSMSAHSRLGTKRVGSAIFLRAWALELMTCSFRPYIHLSWSRATTPILRLSTRERA